jgi:diguanylate cyclase (GGDEF)-like protein
MTETSMNQARQRTSSVREFANLHRTWVPAVFFAALLIIQALGFVMLGTGRVGLGLSESVLIVDNLLALTCVWIAFRRAQGIAALFWFLFAAVLVVLLVPTGFQAFETLFHRTVLSVSTWRLLYCLYGAPILMMLFLPESHRRARWESAVFLDLFQVAIVVGLVYSTFFFFPAQRMLPAEALLRNISISDEQSLILLAAAFVRLRFARVVATRSLLSRLTFFLLICAVATFIGDWIDLHHYASASAWFDLGWAVPQVVAGIVAITWKPSPETQSEAEPETFLSFLGTNLVLVTMLFSIALLLDRWKQAYGEILTYVAIAASLLAFTFRLALTQFSQQQEIGRRQAAQNEASVSHQKVGLLLDDARRQTAEMTQINKLGSLLQVCSSREEVLRLIPESLRRLFAGTSGSISLLNASKVRLQSVAEWGVRPADRIFTSEQCWALRSGRTYIHRGGLALSRCSHLLGEGPSICIPLIANGHTIGILTIQDDHLLTPVLEVDGKFGGFARCCRLAVAVAEQVTLTIANLELRESLRLQAVRDPLTGLYNRRYLDEFLERELLSARRKHSPLALLLLDLDHFKRFNDNFGHTAGDQILATVGEIVQRCMSADDVACRYAGDEFAIVLPESTLMEAIVRAEQIRKRLEEHHAESGGQADLPSISIGVAAYDETTDRVNLLLNFAEYALGQAKRNGRNRVVVARPAVSLPTSAAIETDPMIPVPNG